MDTVIKNIPKILKGDWVKHNSQYESGLCKDIGWDLSANRYFDAKCGNLCIEIKKGQSIWLDLVRYSEIFLGQGVQDTITAFFIPNKNRTAIQCIHFVETSAIISLLGINEDSATRLLELKNRVPRSLNAQARLTVSDVISIAYKTVCLDE